MICVSIGHCDAGKASELATGHELVEFRLDSITGVEDHIPRLFGNHRAIATCRPEFGKGRTRLLLAAISAGAAYADLELEADEKWRKRCTEAARAHHTSVILSHHNTTGTPADAELKNWVRRGMDAGADIVKLACYCHSHEDCVRLLQLACEKPEQTVILGMGPFGIPSRILGPLFGSPFTFAAPDEHEGTAPGQLSFAQMKSIIDVIGNRMYDD